MIAVGAEAVAHGVDRRVDRVGPSSANGSTSCTASSFSRLATEMPTSVRPARSISACAAASSARAVARIVERLRGRARQRVRARRPREVAEAQPQDDRAPDPPGRPHPPGDAVDERDERRRRAPRASVDERPSARCAPIEPRRRPGSHPPRVVVARERVELPARRRGRAGRRAPPRASRRPRPTVVMPTRVQLARRRRPHAPEPLDRERVEERRARGRAARRAARRASRRRSPPWRGTSSAPRRP